MKNIVDAKGLSCPQPVILILKAIKEAKGDEFTVLVDTNTSKENIIRAARSESWESKDIEKVDDGYKIVLRKGK